MNAERVALGVEIVALPRHSDERHLRQRDLPARIKDAVFGGAAGEYQVQARSLAAGSRS